MISRNLNSGAPVEAVSICYLHILRNFLPLLLFYFVCQVSGGNEGFYQGINGTSPFYLIAALLQPVYRLVRAVPESLWTPIFWLPLSSAVFYGFGPLVAVYGNEQTLWYLGMGRLAATHAEVFRANALCAMGIFGLVFGFFLHTRLRANLWQPTRKMTGAASLARPLHIAITFIVAGAVLKYAIMKPAEWGMASYTVPGVITTLSIIMDVGYGLLRFLVTRQRNSMLAGFFWLTWPLHLFLCTLSMSKTELVIALLLPAIGAYMGHRNIKRLVSNFVLMAMVFMMAQPWVHFGRGEISARTGTIYLADYSERTQILGRYFGSEHQNNVRNTEVQGWWTRLNFSHVQAYAMKAYDGGNAGSTLENAWMLFVPRLIWPNKPIIVGPGKSFHALVTGGTGTSFLALSVYGDLYWQFGWLGVVVFCPLIGWFFAMMAWRSLVIMRRRQFIMLPLVLIALEASLSGMNKYVVNGIIAVVPMYYAYLIMMIIIFNLLKPYLNRKEFVAGLLFSGKDS